MSEHWKQAKEDYSGWLDKIPANEPPYWYESVALGDDGQPLTGFFLLPATYKYRRYPQAKIDAMEAERRAVEAQQALAFDLLPVYNPNVWPRCPKCDGVTYKVRYVAGVERNEYGGRSTLIRSCRTCRAQARLKPLDWENPR